jgi:hypothetical protein
MIVAENNNFIKITLRQEYVLLTGNYKKAILLESFIMKQKKSEEWFNLSYYHISKDSLLGLNLVNIRRHVNDLITRGWISRKKDEDSLTYKYKVNLDKIKKDVAKIDGEHDYEKELKKKFI